MITLYAVMADGSPIYMAENVLGSQDWDPHTTKATSARLSIEDCKSGTLTFTIAKDNQAYDKIKFMKTIIEVYEYVYSDSATKYDSPSEMNIIWRGRPIDVEEDIQGNRTFECEGALAFLGDIFQNGYIIGTSTTSGVYSKDQLCKVYLDNLLNSSGNLMGTVEKDANSSLNGCIISFGGGYNKKVDTKHQIRLGVVDVIPAMVYEHEANPEEGQEEPYYSLESDTGIAESVLDRIFATLVEPNGGHLNIRHTMSSMYLDYRGDYLNERDDNIAGYGVNILDLTKTVEISKPVTAIIPMGKTAVRQSVGVTAAESTQPEQTPELEELGIGSIVMFIGNYHYVASTSNDGYEATPGMARITNMNPSAPHPYHLVHIDDTSNVYGWVNESDIQRITEEEPEPEEPTEPEEPEEPKDKDEEETESEEKRLYHIGIRDNPHGTGVYVINWELYAKYGRIEEAVDFGDVDTDEELLKLAEAWFKENSFESTSFEVSMLDLGRVHGSGMRPIHLLDLIHVKSEFNDVDEYFPVTKLDIDLINPANTVITCNKRGGEDLSHRLVSDIRVQKIEKNKTAINASKITEIDGLSIVKDFDKKYLQYDIENYHRWRLYSSSGDHDTTAVPKNIRAVAQYDINKYNIVGGNMLDDIPSLPITSDNSQGAYGYFMPFSCLKTISIGSNPNLTTSTGFYRDINRSNRENGVYITPIDAYTIGSGFSYTIDQSMFSKVCGTSNGYGSCFARTFIIPQAENGWSSYVCVIILYTINGVTYYGASLNNVYLGTNIVYSMPPSYKRNKDADTSYGYDYFRDLAGEYHSGVRWGTVCEAANYNAVRIPPIASGISDGVYHNTQTIGLSMVIDTVNLVACPSLCYTVANPSFTPTDANNVSQVHAGYLSSFVPSYTGQLSFLNSYHNDGRAYCDTGKVLYSASYKMGLIPTSIRNAPSRLYIFDSMDNPGFVQLFNELRSTYKA